MSEEVTLDDFAEQDEDDDVSDDHPRFGSLPNDWKISEIANIAEVVGGSTPSTSDQEYWGGGIPWATPTDITALSGNTISETEDTITEEGLESTSTHLLPPKSVLMTSRATIGKCAINTVEMATNQGFKNLVPSDEIEPWYLYYRMLDTAAFLNSLGSGSTFDEVSKTEVQSVDIPVPPLPEQRKIATVLYTIDRAIEKTEEVIQQYGSLKSGALEDLLRNGLKNHNQIERNIGPLTWELPDSWSVRPVGELAELVHGHQFRSGDFSDDGEVPVLKIGQITASGINLSNADCVPEQELGDYADYAIEEDSPLIALSGATWGKTGYFESYKRPVLQNYRVGKVVSDSSDLDEKYLYYLMQSSIFQKQLRGQVVRQAQENIGKSDFERIRIPIPKISEQERIATIMSDIENCIQSEKVSKQTLEHLKQGLMQDLLSGTIRTTDTNIEVPEEVAQYG